jgi:PhnB protein
MNFARHHRGTVRPYIYGPPSLLDLVTLAFHAVVVEKLDGPSGSHVEVQIGDSMLVMELGEFHLGENVTRASIYVYVPDVDEAYRAGLAAGAVSVSEPEDKPYQERSAGLRDPLGNIWWIATFTGTHPLPPKR